MDKFTERDNKVRKWVNEGPDRCFSISIGITRLDPPEYAKSNGIYTITLKEGGKTVVKLQADSLEKVWDMFDTTQQVSDE